MAGKSDSKSVAPNGKDRKLSGKDVRGFAPDTGKGGRPGGNAGPDSKITGAVLHEGNTGSLMGGMSSYRGKGGK